METPVALSVPFEEALRVATAHEHVADVELQAYYCRVSTFDKEVVRDDVVNLLHVVRLVVKREPDAALPRRRAGRVEPVGPESPGVERLVGLCRQARHDQIVVPEYLCGLNAPVPIPQE